MTEVSEQSRDGEQNRNGERAPVIEWRKVVLGAFAAAVTAAGVVTVIGRTAGFSDIKRTFEDGVLTWLLVCAAGQLVVFAGYAHVYRHAVHFESGPWIRRRLALRVVITGFGFAQLIAAAGAASLVVNYWAMRRLGFPRREAAVRLIGFQTLVYLMFGLVGWTAALLSLLLGDAPYGMTLPWLVAIPVLVVAARWFTMPDRVVPWTEARDGWFRRGLSLGISAAWWVRRALGAREGRPMTVGAACYWIGDAASVWGGLRSFGADVPLTALVLAYATGYIASALPLPFIATGGVDAAMTFSLAAVGVPLDVALLGVVAHRVFAFWLPLVPALFLAARLRRTGRELERVGQARSAALV